MFGFVLPSSTMSFSKQFSLLLPSSINTFCHTMLHVVDVFIHILSKKFAQFSFKIIFRRCCRSKTLFRINSFYVCSKVMKILGGSLADRFWYQCTDKIESLRCFIILLYSQPIVILIYVSNPFCKNHLILKNVCCHPPKHFYCIQKFYCNCWRLKVKSDSKKALLCNCRYRPSMAVSSAYSFFMLLKEILLDLFLHSLALCKTKITSNYDFIKLCEIVRLSFEELTSFEIRIHPCSF